MQGCFLETLNEIGEITPDIKKMAEEADVDILKSWTKIAARADSMEEFLEKIK